MIAGKKWQWYLFIVIYMVMSVTSVGMHTADYGEFQPGVLTTKLLASYIDMSLTELVAWSGVCALAVEFYTQADRKKQRNIFLAVETGWMLLVIGVLTYEVFVIHDRPLYIGGGGAPMDGKTGGLSLAELGCFITALPAIYLLAANIKRVTKTERNILIVTFPFPFGQTIPNGRNIAVFLITSIKMSFISGRPTGSTNGIGSVRKGNTFAFSKTGGCISLLQAACQGMITGLVCWQRRRSRLDGPPGRLRTAAWCVWSPVLPEGSKARSAIPAVPGCFLLRKL